MVWSAADQACCIKIRYTRGNGWCEEFCCYYVLSRKKIVPIDDDNYWSRVDVVWYMRRERRKRTKLQNWRRDLRLHSWRTHENVNPRSRKEPELSIVYCRFSYKKQLRGVRTFPFSNILTDRRAWRGSFLIGHSQNAMGFRKKKWCQDLSDSEVTRSYGVLTSGDTNHQPKHHRSL